MILFLFKDGIIFQKESLFYIFSKIFYYYIIFILYLSKHLVYVILKLFIQIYTANIKNIYFMKKKTGKLWIPLTIPDNAGNELVLLLSPIDNN